MRADWDVIVIGPPIRPQPDRPARPGRRFAGAILTAGSTIEQVMAVTSTAGLITAIYFVGNPDKHTSVSHPSLVQ